MRYLLIQSGDGYREYPVMEKKDSKEEGEAGGWQLICGGVERQKVRSDERVFCLGEERHMFVRGENISISSGEEAVIRIPALEGRIYIRGMQLFFDAGSREGSGCLYLNQQKLMLKDAVLCPGDVLFLKSLKIEIWEDRIAVQGSHGDYVAVLQECSLMRRTEGFTVYKRSPRLMKKPSAEKIFLEPPKERERTDKRGLLMNVLPSVAMTAVTVGIGMVTGRGIYLLMSAAATGMTAVISMVRYMDEKKLLRRRNEKQEERYLHYLKGKQKEIAVIYEKEQEVYSYRYPKLTELAGLIREGDSRLYERIPSDEDFLTVPAGRYMGHPRFVIEGKEPAWDAAESALAEAWKEVRKRYSMIDQPRVVDLKKAHLGIVGEKEVLHRQIRIMAARLAFSHSYHDLRMIVIYDKRYEEEFRWMRWLRHVRIPVLNIFGLVSDERSRDLVLGSMGQVLKERAERAGDGKKNRCLPHYLFLIEEPSWVMDHKIMEYLRMDGKVLGFSVICTGDSREDLPEHTGTVLQLENSEEGTLLLDTREYVEQKLKLYQAQDVDFEWLARDLSMAEHKQERTGSMPGSVTFFELYGIRHPEELEIRKRWKEGQSHQSLAVPLGLRSADDILNLNLHEKAHGPHGLVAGTTGSGKSELLQSYILSLAVNFHPHEVGFLLIDYKGGGMANLFHGLPHHMGTITNLDGSGSMRALVSVKAELSRRQRIFGRFQVNHINGYMRLFKEGTAAEPIPHLFLICDEFAELKKEQPDFMKELISAARIGRSLGVHLILATQKPAGVVDEQILSNSRCRLCLKVQNEGDSKEVLRTPDAADITVPGRAYIQVGNNEVYEIFQSAWSGSAYRETEGNDEADNRVYVVNELGQGELINQDLSGKTEEYQVCMTQLEAVAAHIIEVSGKEGIAELKKPWLQPLEKMLVSPYIAEGLQGSRSGSELAVYLGKMDIPERQEQKELEHNFTKDGNLLYTASSGFGKTVFLTTVLVSLAAVWDVDELNYYILDYGNNGCMPLKELPHTAEYIPLDDEERYQKFKKRITEEIVERKRMFARCAAPSWEAYRELSKEPLKAIIVAVDQFDVVKESGIEEEEFFTRLTRDGAGLGIYMAASANRVNAIRQATLNNFKKKIAGYNFDENETFQTIGRTSYRQSEIRGRVLVGGECVHEAQIYTMAPGESMTQYGKELRSLIQKIRRKYPGKEAPHIPVLPQEFLSSTMEGYADDGSCYRVGLEMEEVILKGFDRAAGLFVIIGNTGTGKTNMLRVLADQAVSRGRACLFDSGGMEMYDYRQLTDVLYVEGKKEADLFMEIMSQELEARKKFLKEKLGELQGASPKKLVEETPFCTILIDDLDDFSGSMKPDLEKIASLIKEGITLGITCIITVHAAKSRGMGTMDRLIRQAAEGLVLSSQGVVPIFPVLGIREIPELGEGVLFKNGVGKRLLLPRHTDRTLTGKR